MDSSTKWVALTSFIVAVAFAAALTVNVPPYISGTPLSNGLIARLHFSKEYYNAVEPVNATFEYYNPTSNPVTFTPENMLYVEAGYEGQFLKRHIRGISPIGAITLRPGETYAPASFHYPALVPGVFSIDVNGTRGSVEIIQGQLVARIKTDREVYTVGQGGTATLEIYNSGSSPLSYENFSPYVLHFGYLDEPMEKWRISSVYVDYIYRFATVQPGESRVVWSLDFTTPRAGILVLDFNSVVKRVTVLPGG